MKQEIHRYQCNQCSKESEIDKLNPRFGGYSPFHGWIHVQKETSGIHNSCDGDTGPWDFCCAGCLVEFFVEFEEKA
jgi:hypothetical protein